MSESRTGFDKGGKGSRVSCSKGSKGMIRFRSAHLNPRLNRQHSSKLRLWCGICGSIRYKLSSIYIHTTNIYTCSNIWMLPSFHHFTTPNKTTRGNWNSPPGLHAAAWTPHLITSNAPATSLSLRLHLGSNSTVGWKGWKGWVKGREKYIPMT